MFCVPITLAKTGLRRGQEWLHRTRVDRLHHFATGRRTAA